PGHAGRAHAQAGARGAPRRVRVSRGGAGAVAQDVTLGGVMVKLAGRVAVVVGASSGIGLAVARALAAEGARVHALARRVDLIERTERIVPRRLDATDERAVAAFFAELGDVDVLVYAAGTNVKNRRFAEPDPGAGRTVVETNLSGAVHVMRAALPALRRRRGLAVLIAS